MKFTSASPVISDKDAAIIGRFLYDKFPDGKFTAKQVLELAEPKNSPIHRFFTWDDTKAARLWRLAQARKLIRCLVVVIKDTHTPAYHHVTVEQSQYVSTEVAQSVPSIWDQVLERALQEALSWKRRYQNLKEVSPVVKAIEKLERELSHAKTKERKQRNRKVVHRSNSAHQV